MAEESATRNAREMFTNWGRGMDDGQLDLWVQREGKIVDSASLDVTELPNRLDLLDRMPPVMKLRMLWDAREVAKGNVSLSPSFPGYDGSGSA
jgi:hypothetical protein